MTLVNNWLKNEILRAFISGESREAIASQLKVSVGTVNSLVKEILKSDDTADLQRQIAIVAKKQGVSLKQIAANLRYKNLIKLNMLDERKSEKFLNAIDTLCNKYSIPPSDAANQFFSLIELMQRENVEPHKLEEIIKSSVSELREIERRKDAKRKSFEDTKLKVDEDMKRLKIKEKQLAVFGQIMSMLEMYDYSEFSSENFAVARTLIDIKEQGFDPKVIVSKHEEFVSTTEEIKRQKTILREFEKIMRHYQRKQDEEEAKWEDHGKAFQSFTDLKRDGLKDEDILTVVHIIKNDFPQRTIKQLIEDIRTYGNIAAAISKLKGENES